MRAQNAVVEKKSANGIGDGGEGGSSIEHKAQKSKSAQRGKNESAEGKGEEAGGSKSKLNGHSDCIMELLAEIQMDIKTNRRQCEKIEQVLASHHTRAIEETNAAIHDAKAAIEVVRQMRAATLSPYSSPSSLLTPRSPYSSPSSFCASLGDRLQGCPSLFPLRSHRTCTLSKSLLTETLGSSWICNSHSYI